MRRLIINADDFGASKAINRAVLRAYTSGILTSSSLMVSGEYSDEAFLMAKEHTGLGVGIHLT
ncbi:MAG: ChbG/HpnK family deacetylase, partial [Nitrospirae bacterium]